MIPELRETDGALSDFALGCVCRVSNMHVLAGARHRTGRVGRQNYGHGSTCSGFSHGTPRLNRVDGDLCFPNCSAADFIRPMMPHFDAD